MLWQQQLPQESIISLWQMNLRSRRRSSTSLIRTLMTERRSKVAKYFWCASQFAKHAARGPIDPFILRDLDLWTSETHTNNFRASGKFISPPAVLPSIRWLISCAIFVNFTSNASTWREKAFYQVSFFVTASRHFYRKTTAVLRP